MSERALGPGQRRHHVAQLAQLAHLAPVALLTLVFLCVAQVAAGQTATAGDAGAAGGGTATAPPATAEGAATTGLDEDKARESTLEQWRQTIQFGIDSEVLELVQQLGRAREDALNDELAQLMRQSRNPEIRREILEVFRAVEHFPVGAEALATVERAVDDPTYGTSRRDRALLTSAMYYLAESGDGPALEPIVALLGHGDTVVAIAAIKAVGSSGKVEHAPQLLQRLDDPTYAEDLKPDLILALGELQAPAAVQALESIASDSAAARTWRMYAADSLGKIRAASSLDVLVGLFEQEDPLIKAYAAAALGHYEGDRVVDALISGLRDSHWRVRTEAAAGLARLGARAAVPILRYKVERDPEQRVRSAAITALAQIRSGDSREYLRGVVNDRGKSLQVREQALRALMQHDLAASLALVGDVVDAQWTARPPTLLVAVAQELLAAEDAAGARFYERFLSSPHASLRVYGVRGAARSRITRLRPELEMLAVSDAVAAVRVEAELALSKL